jgi:NAD-dependent deacetylase
MVLTGAGLSAASGIPTFRGDNGFWKKSYNGVSNPEQILTMSYFNLFPAVTWEWHWDFIDLMKKCKPNKGHQVIRDF